MRYIQTYEESSIVLYWKVYTRFSGRITEIALYKIDKDCLEYFKYEVEYINYMRDNEFVWIYKNRFNAWDWDESKIQNPEKRYKNEKFKFMGEIKVNKEDIANYNIYLDTKKYNL